MCGITGKISARGVSRELIESMAATLSHRGPDEAGTYVDRGAGLGHRRLSVIDLSHGRQPIANEDETLWIVFNGEIYNYQDLRSDLVERGHQFRTDTDTEVILHLYEEYGPSCLKYLRGMFAFAIWDSKREQLFAARDHLGQKPFFYVHQSGELLFGSEIKALVVADPSLAEIDLESLDQYLTLRVIASPRSMFRRIRKLPPAHYLLFDANGITIERYWDLEYEPKLKGSDQELLEELEDRLVDCLRLHMVADVPVGAYMSGGLDSTLIVAMLCEHGLANQLQTFSMGLPYRQFDEAPYARMVAEHYGTRHHEEVVTPSLIDALPQLVWHLDEPSDPLAICQFLISEMARKHVKVVLGGDGGDELFGGYDRYYGNRYTDYYAMVPYAVRRFAFGPALRLLPDGGWYKSKSHQLKWMHRLSFDQGGRRYAKSLGYFFFGGPIRNRFYGAEMEKMVDGFDAEASIREPFDRVIANDVVDRMLYADTQVRLPDHPVMILDRTTMAHGLEARAPFMDHRFTEFAALLPSRMKVRGRCTRFIQRRLAEKYLPRPVLERPKQGFQSALPYMLKDEYRLLFGLFLSQSQLARDEILCQQPIDELLQEHLAGKSDHGNRLWLLLNSEVWYRMKIQGEGVEELSALIGESARKEKVA